MNLIATIFFYFDRDRSLKIDRCYDLSKQGMAGVDPKFLKNTTA